MGLAREANPLLDELVNGHAVGFVAVKLGLVGLGSWLLWHYRRRPTAVVAIFIAFLAYYFLLLYHLRFAALLTRELLGS
jgi:formate hydrogenlyase subunit 3/multisubunit Na+/H+ antiporter MnhD subunit